MPWPTPPHAGPNTQEAGLTHAATLAEAPVSRGTLVAAGAADSWQAAALASLCIAAASHCADVAVTPPAARASLEAIVSLLGNSRTVGDLFTVPPSWGRLR